MYVRIRADGSDVTQKLRGVERSLAGVGVAANRLDGGMRTANLSTGRLQGALMSLVTQSTGTNRAVGTLIATLGSFAVGGGVVLAATLGIAAIAKAYELITSEAKKATKEQKELIENLEKAIHLKSLGPGGETVDQVGAANARANTLRAEINRLEAQLAQPEVLGSSSVAQADRRAREIAEEKLRVAYIELHNARAAAAGGKSIIDEKVKDAMDAAKPKVEKLKDTYMDLRDAIEKAREEAERMGRDFWRNIMNNTGEEFELTQRMRDLLPSSDANIKAGAAAPDISDSVRDANRDLLKGTEDHIDAAKKNSDDMKEAIWGAASQASRIIVSALNIGGGGRGSGLGGAIGSTAGFALGFAFGGGPIGGAIGSTIGNIAGSFIGGLFDNKKATDANTSATRALTQAMLLNAPSGFKVEPYRYGASIAASRGGTTVNIDARGSDAKEIARLVGKYATRGGAPLLGAT